MYLADLTSMKTKLKTEVKPEVTTDASSDTNKTSPSSDKTTDGAGDGEVKVKTEPGAATTQTASGKEAKDAGKKTSSGEKPRLGISEAVRAEMERIVAENRRIQDLATTVHQKNHEIMLKVHTRGRSRNNVLSLTQFSHLSPRPPSAETFPLLPDIPLRRFPSILISATVFCFISSFHVPKPFQPSHDHRYRFHPFILQDLLISSMFYRLTLHFANLQEHQTPQISELCCKCCREYENVPGFAIIFLRKIENIAKLKTATNLKCCKCAVLFRLLPLPLS